MLFSPVATPTTSPARSAPHTPWSRVERRDQRPAVVDVPRLFRRCTDDIVVFVDRERRPDSRPRDQGEHAEVEEVQARPGRASPLVRADDGFPTSASRRIDPGGNAWRASASLARIAAACGWFAFEQVQPLRYQRSASLYRPMRSRSTLCAAVRSAPRPRSSRTSARPASSTARKLRDVTERLGDFEQLWLGCSDDAHCQGGDELRGLDVRALRSRSVCGNTRIAPGTIACPAS